MTKLETLKAEQMELVENIDWTESNLEGITEEEKELYIYELNELETVTKQIAQVTEWEQLGYHENRIVELFNSAYPVVEIFETITQTLGNNGAKKEITLFNDARILIEKSDNNGKVIWHLFKDATTNNLEWLLKQGFTNKIFEVMRVV